MNHQTVVVIEDEASIRTVIESVLTVEGYTVWTAKNGAEALALLERGVVPTVIILDMRMPVMSGWEFAKQYRARTIKPAPLIVVTAAQDAAKWASEIEADAVLDKPFDLDELLTTVRHTITRESPPPKMPESAERAHPSE